MRAVEFCDVEIHIGDDYRIENVITFFESYMFVTTDKWIKQHKNPIEGEITIVDKDGKEKISPMEDLNLRKELLTKFNKSFKTKNPKFPSSFNTGVFVLEFINPNDVYFNSPIWKQAYINKYIFIRDTLINWAKEEEQVIAIVTHFEQYKNIDGKMYFRPPHIHVIYTKENSKQKDLAQKYLFKKFKEKYD